MAPQHLGIHIGVLVDSRFGCTQDRLQKTVFFPFAFRASFGPRGLRLSPRGPACYRRVRGRVEGSPIYEMGQRCWVVIGIVVTIVNIYFWYCRAGSVGGSGSRRGCP